MSADNFNQVRHVDGWWCVWLNLSASCQQEQIEGELRTKEPAGRFLSRDNAVEWANEQCEAEYGTYVDEEIEIVRHTDEDGVIWRIVQEDAGSAIHMLEYLSEGLDSEWVSATEVGGPREDQQLDEYIRSYLASYKGLPGPWTGHAPVAQIERAMKLHKERCPWAHHRTCPEYLELVVRMINIGIDPPSWFPPKLPSQWPPPVKPVDPESNVYIESVPLIFHMENGADSMDMHVYSHKFRAPMDGWVTHVRADTFVTRDGVEVVAGDRIKINDQLLLARRRSDTSVECNEFLCLPEVNPSHYVNERHLPIRKKGTS